MKRQILSARESIQANLRTFLDGIPPEDLDRVCQIVADGFVPVIEEADSKTRKALALTQIGEEYRVERTTNLLDIRVNSRMTKTQVAEHLRNGISIVVSRNK